MELEDGQLYLKVSNKASDRQSIKQKGGFGSPSFEERLKIIYGDFFHLNKIVLKGTYTAILKINLREFYNKMRHTG